MPVILGPDDYAAWLGEEPATPDQLKSMLRPYPSERLTMWPVDRRVGNVKNEDAELAEPVTTRSIARDRRWAFGWKACSSH
jgi:putative SOS response-associated peptidase YedK